MSKQNLQGSSNNKATFAPCCGFTAFLSFKTSTLYPVTSFIIENSFIFQYQKVTTYSHN